MGVRDNQTKILLGIFLLGSEKFEPVKLDETFCSLTDLTINERTKGFLSSLVKESYLEKVENNNEKPSYKLSDNGFYFLCIKFPFVRFLKDEWDGKWRIISYEIPEVKRHLRDRLRREMEGWGLGPWHRSFWLTPHPVIENLRDLVLGKEEEQYVQAFTADHSFGDKTVLIKKVFKIDDLESQYKNLFKKWYEVLSTNLDNTEKFKKVIVEYVEVLKTDPGLPVNILGSAWIGFEGWRLFNEIKSLLYKPNNG